MKVRLKSARVIIYLEFNKIVDQTDFERMKKKIRKDLTDQFGHFDDNGRPLPESHPHQPSADFTYDLLPE